MKTDAELRSDVEHEFEWDAGINAHNITVAAKNGIVTLTGEVDNFSQKWHAETVAKRIRGVVGIANDIEIRILGERTDPDIAQAAALALQLDSRIPFERVQITVEHGWLTLNGQLDSYHQKTSAESAVRHLAGVTGVTNAIAVTASGASAEVKDKIQAALRRSARLDPGRIAIEIRDNMVILTGSVDSWSDRDEAEVAAWRAPGVLIVENRLIVQA